MRSAVRKLKTREICPVRRSQPPALEAAIRDATWRLAHTRPGAELLDAWRGLVFLSREVDRLGKRVFMVRVMFGTCPPARFGPYDTHPEAQKAFRDLRSTMWNDLDGMLGDLQIRHDMRCSQDEF
jgi:hypothetical protein